MRRLRFCDLPMVVRVTSVLSMAAAWVLFEQYFIEGLHLNRFMPFYRVQGFCPYDAMALLMIVTFWVLAHRRNDNESTQP
jgi:hypothetical protein